MKDQQKEKTNNATSLVSRDGKNLSPWQSINFTENPSVVQSNTIYDVVVIGGGITGISTALLLQQQGKKCLVLEGKTLGFGTTGGTTAHLNTFFDTTYPDIEQDFGETAAKTVAEAGKKALSIIKDMVTRFSIDCDYEEKNALLFSENEKETKELQKIFESSKKAGVQVNEVIDNHLPIPSEHVLQFNGQGQFHPLKYLSTLTKEFLRAGGTIAENQFVKNTEFKDGLHYAKTEELTIIGRNIVHATHVPQGINLFNFRCAAYRSYVIGVTLTKEDYPDELIYDMQEPYHYFRTHSINGKKYLLIGGADHKTGHDDPEVAFSGLIAYAKSYFDIKEINYKWSSQYYIPTDGLPYIGNSPGQEGVYVATGYNGNGMIYGTLASYIISDAIMQRENPFSSLFNPSRIKPVAGFTEFVKENADTAWRFIADRFSAEKIESLKEISNDTGCLIDHDGKRLAIYKDINGKIHALNPTCTHAGCIVNWNMTEKSWDCPCHGGRFDIEGKVVSGPPRNDLQKIEINDGSLNQ